jgi:glycosyltransferase involved in cell wall biosynthesis
MNSNPLVSIIIPVYNGERYLSQAIASAQEQTYRPIEIIIVDDGSSDGSALVARRYPSIRYFLQNHAGLGAALNHGVRQANGDFLAFLDADDLWINSKLTTQVHAFTQNPHVDIVFGYIQEFLSPELLESKKMLPAGSDRIIAGYSKGTMLIRRDAFSRVGPFSQKWRVGDFIDWYMRAVEKGLHSLMLPDVLMRRRLHSNNMGLDEANLQSDYVRILKAALDRRRGKNDS